MVDMEETFKQWIYRIRSQDRRMKSGRGGLLSEKDFKALQELKDRMNSVTPIYPIKLYKMNPIVLIATHQRLEITRRNIKSLLAQSLVPKIVIVVSDYFEMDVLKSEFPFITIIHAPNRPLGAKWQAGVLVCRKMEANPLIITGSDDILCNIYVQTACDYMHFGIDFIGLKRWYVHHKDVLYLFRYMASQPLGGGRVYSKEMLEKIKYKLFDVRKERLLDDQGYDLVKQSGLKTIIRDYDTNVNGNVGLEIMAVKGNWVTMNPFEKMMNHPNAKLLQTYENPERILQELFG